MFCRQLMVYRDTPDLEIASVWLQQLLWLLFWLVVLIQQVALHLDAQFHYLFQQRRQDLRLLRHPLCLNRRVLALRLHHQMALVAEALWMHIGHTATLALQVS